MILKYLFICLILLNFMYGIIADGCGRKKALILSLLLVAMTENSFWSEHGVSPVPLSPFRSPTFTDTATTSKKRQRSEADVCQLESSAKIHLEQELQ